MIETENRRVSSSTRENQDEWLADLARTASNRIYAEKRDVNAYGAAGVERSREADMADRYDKNSYGSRDNHYGTTAKPVPPSQDADYYDDYHDNTATKQAAHSHEAYSYEDEQDDQGPEWTYDEKLDLWVDRYGNPYVEAYAEGEEDRYAPAEDEYLAPQADALRARSQRKSRGSAVSLAALVLVASIGGGLAYAWKKGGFIGSDLPGIGSAPPVIKASTDPVKIKPTETASANDQPTREIFDRSTPTPPANERLVRHEEQPMAVVPVRTEGGAPAGGNATPDATRPVTTSNITLPPSDATATSDQTAAAGNLGSIGPSDQSGEPRQVRTVKVMPDNSVVTGEAPITSAPPAPSIDVANATPDTATIGNASTQVPPSQNGPTATSGDVPAQVSPSQNSSVTTPQPAATPPVTPPPVTTSQPALDADPSVPPAQSTAITPVTTTPVNTLPAVPSAALPPVSPTTNDDASATTVAEPAPQASRPPAIPPVRPRNIPAATPRNIPTPTQQVASAEPVTAPVAAGGAGYVVQVSSQKSPAEAQAAFQALQRKYAAVLGSMKPSIRKVDLPDRGTYYRVRVGSWDSSNEAGAFCAKLKAAGGDCVISRN
ncbi:SPOR domain-containing protein [Labrys okinawensis]|uniref:SPOR domain-containing protein n=1 Tax=Labrys okinawensis TaxID=346911 RepID=UPI0039BC7829